MGKYSNASYFENTHQMTLIFSRSCHMKLFLMTHVQLLSNDLPQGHLRSQRGHRGFLPITFDRVKIENWKWRQCVCLVNTHRLIWNLTHLGHIGSPRDLDLRSTFENDLSRSSSIWFEPNWREKHDGVICFVLALLVKKLFAKNNFQENGHFGFRDFFCLNYWPEKISEGIQQKTCFKSYRTFVFRFLLAIIVPEIFGGFRNNVHI